MSDGSELPCGPSADARYCPAFWELRSECDDYRVLLDRLADAAERFVLSGAGDPADLLAEIESARAAIGGNREPVKPVVIVFDINEGIQQWFDDLAEAVKQQSGGKVIITDVDAEMSDVMLAVADREIAVDEAVAIWHGQHGGDDA